MRGCRLGVALVPLLLSLAFPLSALAARPKTDLVVLNNGDRLTGEIKGLSRGRLSLDVSAMGIVSIKWDRVTEVTTAFSYQVETESGERLLGTLSSAAPGSLVVIDVAGARRTLALRSIVGLDPIGRSFWSRLDGSVDLGGSYTQSGGVAQLYVNFWTTARRPAFEWRLAFDDYLTLKSEGTSSEQLSASFGYSRYVSGRWAVFGQAQVERTPDLGFDFRGTLLGGAERTLARSNHSEIVVGAGLGGSQERPVEGETEVQLTGILAFRQSLFLYDTPKTTLDTQFSAYPILNQLPRWRIKADASLKRELFKDFSVGVTFFESFDSRPSSADARRNDLGATLTIGYTF